MEKQKEEQIINDEEITLRELILKVKEFIYELWRYKFIIALFCLPFLVYMLFKAIKTPVTYPASLTFMVDDQDQGGISPISSILGQFGLPARRGAYNLDRILDIPLVLSAQLGNTRMLIKDLLQLGPGSIVELDKLAGEPLEVLVNERLVARGEVVMVNEKFGIRLTDVISPTERVNKLR